MTEHPEPIRIETVGGLRCDYYHVLFPGSTVFTTFALTEAGRLKERVAGRAVNWVKGKNVFKGEPMTEEKFRAMVAHYEEA